MSEHNDILANLRKTLAEEGIDSFHILEELVPIEEQMDFFRFFEKVRRENAPFDRDEEISILFSPDETIERKKLSLCRLASIADVGAYRSIETYHSSPLEDELKNWSAMALVSSRIVLSSDLSGHQQIYISSGLGGHANKLRFFALFTTVDRAPFSQLQKEIVEREFKFQLQLAGIEIEKFEIHDNYFTILMLFPFDLDVKSSLNAAIDECNQYGNFLDERYLFTNLKILSEEEIKRLLSK